MWSIYDELLRAMPADVQVQDCLLGRNWCLVRSLSVGIAMVPTDAADTLPPTNEFAGRPVRELANWIKSWSPIEAAIGQAAINSVLNHPATAAAHLGASLASSTDQDTFAILQQEFTDKRVAIIGHFRNLQPFAHAAKLSIFERKPQPGDYPDTAAEFLLPDHDFVVITASALANKTLPRLLQLSRGARVVIAGPSLPLHPVFFRHGVEVIGGFIVQDAERIWQVVREGGDRRLFQTAGHRVTATGPTASRLA